MGVAEVGGEVMRGNPVVRGLLVALLLAVPASMSGMGPWSTASSAKRDIAIDVTNPVCTITVDGVIPDDPTTIRSNPVTVDVGCSDAGSGIATTLATLDGVAFAGPVTVAEEGTHVVKVTAVDFADLATTATRTIQIDVTNPVCTITVDGVIPDDPTTIRSNPVTVDVGCSDAGSGIASLSATLDGTPFTGRAVVREEGTHLVEVTATDLAGLVTQATRTIVIDVTNPECTITVDGVIPDDPTTIRSNPVSVDVGCSDAGSGLASALAWLDGQPLVGTASVEAEGTHTVTATATDLAGLSTTASHTILIDRTPPACTIHVEGTLGDNGWRTSPVSVDVQCTDEGSGVAAVFYRVADGAWTSVSDTITIGREGVSVVVAYAVDRAGNVGATVAVSLKIDVTPPVCEVSSEGTLGGDGWRTSPVTVTQTCSDDASGVAAESLRIDGRDAQDGVVVAAEGAHTAEGGATDAAGLSGTSAPVPFKIDTKPPVTTASLQGPRGQGGWFTGPVSVAFQALDEGSGVATTMVSVDGSPPTAVEGTIEVTSEGVHVVVFFSIDWAGNREPARTIEVGIDPTPPGTDVDVGSPNVPASDPPYITSATPVTLHARDATSGVAATWYRVDGGAWQRYSGAFQVQGPDGSKLLDFYSEDRAGNAEAPRELRVHLDNTAPDLAVLRPAQGSVYVGQQAALGTPLAEPPLVVQGVEVTAQASDAGVGMGAVSIYVDGALQATLAAAPFAWYWDVTGLAPGEHKLLVVADDLLGNRSTVERVVRTIGVA